MKRTQMGRGPGRSAASIRRPGTADLAGLGEFFAGLSAQTRYMRFFAPLTPTSAMLRRLSGGAGNPDAVVAVHDGVIIGHAMAADRDDPEGGAVTEIGVVVADAWQRRGVGSALMRVLLARAQARGVTSVIMDVLPDNQHVLNMIVSHWAAARTDHSADCVTIEVRLAPRQRERVQAAPRERLRAAPSARVPAAARRVNRQSVRLKVPLTAHSAATGSIRRAS